MNDNKPDEKPKTDRKGEKKDDEYPEGGIDGMVLRDGAPGREYPLPEPSGIAFTDPMDTARVDLKTFREPPEVTIKRMDDVVTLVKEMEDYDRERMKILHLDTKNQILAIENISTGDIRSSIIHPREAVKGAVLSSATSVIIVHNHPSGNPQPSKEDIEISQVLVNAFELMRISVLDFIIVSKYGAYSFETAGIMPAPQEPAYASKLLDLTAAEGDSEACQLAYRAAREVLDEQCRP